MGLRGSTRRDFLRYSTAAGVAALARPAPAAAAKGTVTIWTPIAAQSTTRKAYVLLKESFERANKDLKAEVVSVGWSPLRDKVFAAVRSRTGPDIVDFQTEQMPSYAALGGFASLDDLFESSGLKSQTWGIAREYGTWNGRMYAVPWGIDVAMGLLYYRQDLFEKAGIKRPPSTLDELAATAQALTRTRADGKGEQWGLAFAGVPGDAFHGGFADVFYGYGGKVFTTRSGKTAIAIDTPETHASLQFVVDLLHKHRVVHPDSPSFNSDQMRSALIRGQVAMVPSGYRHWASQFTPLAKNLIDQGVLRVAPWPAGPAGRRIKLLIMGYHITAFPETDREAAWKFVRTALEPDILGEMAQGAGFGPILKVVWDRPAYRDLEVLRVLRDIVEHHAAPFDSHPLQVPIVRGVMERMTSKALSREQTVAAAIRDAQEQANTMLAEYERKPQ